MLTSFLNLLGMRTGWSRGNDEAYFFHRLNLFIERVCNCGWDNPRPILGLQNCSAKKKYVIEYLKKTMEWPRSGIFFGMEGIFPNNSVTSITGAWGWKDPRNTFTASLWQELFPEARFVHIYRNGVDVAASLKKRELYSPPRLDSIYSSPRVCTLEGGFSLWEEYIEQAFQIQPLHEAEGILHIRYEDFMEKPIEILDAIVDFCRLPRNDSVIHNVATQANASRAFAFLKDEELLKFYQHVKDSFWMKQLRYDEC